MKIVFMGTPDFSVKTLKKLYNDKDIEISYVVTKVDTKSNRGQKINYSDVKKKALEYNLPILQPVKIKDDREVIEKIKSAEPDFIIVVAFGEILSKEILDIPKYACINGHASLLPKYRGASPIQSAILSGDDITGTTTMLMNEGLDSGDILEQESIVVDRKETADTLFEKLSILTSDLILHTIKNFNDIKPIKQNENEVTKSVIIKKEHGKIDFKNETAIEVERKIRAYNSWPSAYIEIGDELIKIWDADVCDDVNVENGESIFENVYIEDDILYAKCKDKFLRINELQKSGKKRMKALDFINGFRR